MSIYIYIYIYFNKTECKYFLIKEGKLFDQYKDILEKVSNIIK